MLECESRQRLLVSFCAHLPSYSRILGAPEGLRFLCDLLLEFAFRKFSGEAQGIQDSFESNDNVVPVMFDSHPVTFE